jgi:hypothetical protein
MTRNPADLIHDDRSRIFMEDINRKLAICLNRRVSLRRRNLDDIIDADNLALHRPPPVNTHHPALDQLLRNPSRRRKSQPHQKMVQPLSD